MNRNQYLDATEWQSQNFKQATALSCVNHLEEEVSELKEAIELGIGDEKEIADCFLLLFGICSKFGMSYEDIYYAIHNKMIENRSRNWGKPNEKGYVKHIDK